MKRGIQLFPVIALAMLASCSQKPAGGPATTAENPPAAAQPAGSGPHAFVHLKDGSRVPGSVVASTQTDLVLAGDDGIERKIPLTQVQSVEYGDAPQQAAREPAVLPKQLEPVRQAPPPPTTTTYVLPAGSQVSVRTNETIDSATAAEGQTFDAQVTRDARDANGDVVIPRRARASIVIRSASRGGHFHGASDLVLDLASVTIDGRRYSISTVDLAEKGKSGVGLNKRTAEFSGGGAALGAIIGAIAGGGKGAAIGAGAGAGAGAVGVIATKGGSVKVPVESVLTFSLDKPLRVVAE